MLVHSIPASNAGEIVTEQSAGSQEHTHGSASAADQEWSGTLGHGWVWYAALDLPDESQALPGERNHRSPFHGRQSAKQTLNLFVL